MTELHIPDEALDAMDIFSGQISRTDLREMADRVAPYIVAAELRRLADAIDTAADPLCDVFMKGEHAGRREIRRLLLGRAAVLDGGTDR